MEQPYWRLRDSLRTGVERQRRVHVQSRAACAGGGGGRRWSRPTVIVGLPGPPATEDTHWAREVDPNRLRGENRTGQVGYLPEETDEFSRIFFAPKRRRASGPQEHERATDQAVTALIAQLQHDEGRRSRAVAWQDAGVSQPLQLSESGDSPTRTATWKTFTYLRHLVLKLPKRKSGPGY